MKYFYLILLVLMPSKVFSQAGKIYGDNIRTLQVIVDENPLLPPVMELRKHQHIEISWDELSHQYHRYIYSIADQIGLPLTRFSRVTSLVD